MVGLSPWHLEHLFKKEMALSIGAFSLEVRLRRARKLLTTTFQSIKQIRCEVGIPNASNFVRHFRQRFDSTPSDYRKSVDSNPD